MLTVSPMPTPFRPTAPVALTTAQKHPAKPLRRATLSGTVRRRDEADIDMDTEANLASFKRSKVTFDPEVKVRLMEDWTDSEKAPELIREEVYHGIEKYAMGETVGYERIKEIFTIKRNADDAPSPATIKSYLLALLGNASLLKRSCSSLVHAILDSQWLGRDEAFVALYVRFLGNLVSARGSYVGSVLRMLVGSLCHVPSLAGRLPNYPVVRRPQIYARVHTALKYLLQLIPSASSSLSPILTASFPHSTDTKKAHIDYVQNLLKVIEYAPELRPDVLALITDRLVKIDVQVQIDMDDLEDDVKETLAGDDAQHSEERGMIKDYEDDGELEDDDSDTSSVDSDDSIDGEARHLREVKANVEKMDSLLDLMFGYYTPFFANKTTDGSDDFNLLLQQFSTTILPTYRSRHTQFILFHFAQSSPWLIDWFTGVCIAQAFDPARPLVFKQIAAAYVGSFVARAANMTKEMVREVFRIVGANIVSYCKKEEAECRGPDVRRYGDFYAATQALLYIFCFRWRELTINNEDRDEDDDPRYYDFCETTWVPGIKDTLHRTIYSKFNPLKVCSPLIVNQFARLANHLRFLYVFPLIESNKRLRLSHTTVSTTNWTYSHPDRETALTARKDELWLELEAYFPFDPYKLPRSKRWIDGEYVEWKGVKGLDDEDEDADSETDREGEYESDEDEEEDEETETEGEE
ncbi:hypothetical protein FGG08_001372 [Glutinoglossum americanum]|uniref:RNA polymerase I-specific transcription initiation factor RRN3 n=1 Tax=Glutinoglossum americanum TaxID=1670608 RepID=A0A9P8IBD5_9PEZI|nr:hypothetical protein FGG08_001372 [Glutinoglossum americanum]